MSDSKLIAQRIQQYLDGEDFHYDFNPEEGIFRFGVVMPNKLQNIQYLIHVLDNRFISYAFCPMGAGEAKEKVAEFLHRANYGMLVGNFEMDYSDGEIRFKYSHVCRDALPSKEQVEESILLPARMFKTYGDGLLAVIFGVKEPQEAVEESEQ